MLLLKKDNREMERVEPFFWRVVLHKKVEQWDDRPTFLTTLYKIVFFSI